MAAAAFTVAATTGCDVDADFGDGVYNVYDIPVYASEWKPVWSADDVMEYMYVDKPMPELDGKVFGRAMYVTYYQFMDGNETVEMPLPYTDYELYEGKEWQYKIESEYSQGNLRLVLTTSDFYPYEFKPNEQWRFRLVIML